MTTTKLDLTGLKCPLPALKTRKTLIFDLRSAAKKMIGTEGGTGVGW